MEQGRGESRELYLQTVSFLLSGFKIKATMATERQAFFSRAECYLSLQRNPYWNKRTICELHFLNALFEWVHLSSILRTYSRVPPFCIKKIPFLSSLHWGNKDGWQLWDLKVLLFYAIVLNFFLPAWKLAVVATAAFLHWINLSYVCTETSPNVTKGDFSTGFLLKQLTKLEQ